MAKKSLQKLHPYGHEISVQSKTKMSNNKRPKYDKKIMKSMEKMT